MTKSRKAASLSITSPFQVTNIPFREACYEYLKRALSPVNRDAP